MVEEALPQRALYISTVNKNGFENTYSYCEGESLYHILKNYIKETRAIQSRLWKTYVQHMYIWLEVVVLV